MEPNLAQRLYATSGRATLADLPFLYAQMQAAQAAKARAQGAGQGMAGEQPVQNLASLDAAGGGAPGTGGGPSGGGGVTFPAAEAISAPGRSGQNAVADFYHGAGRSEGGGYGGGAQGIAGREGEMIGRGFADPTLGNISKAVAFGLGLNGTSPLTIAAGEALKAAGITSMGGLPEFSGYHQFDPDLVQAVQQGQIRLADAVRQQGSRNDRRAFRDANPFAGMAYGNPGAYARAQARGGNAGGGGGNAYGAAEHGNRGMGDAGSPY